MRDRTIEQPGHFIILIMALLCLWTGMSSGVQHMPGGVQINWGRESNDLSYSVWRLPPGTTNWLFTANTTNTSFLYTNAVLRGTMFGITANQRTNGICCVASDVGVAAWPPDITTPQKTVRLTPTNGYTLDLTDPKTSNQWVKVSSDLVTFEDWLKFSVSSNRLNIQHRASPLKPRLYFEYPANPLPPPLP